MTATSPSFSRGVSGEIAHKSETAARLASLRFDSANNAALSLRVLSELVRSERVTVIASNVGPGKVEFLATEAKR